MSSTLPIIVTRLDNIEHLDTQRQVDWKSLTMVEIRPFRVEEEILFHGMSIPGLVFI